MPKRGVKPRTSLSDEAIAMDHAMRAASAAPACEEWSARRKARQRQGSALVRMRLVNPGQLYRVPLGCRVVGLVHRRTVRGTAGAVTGRYSISVCVRARGELC